ncbi:hypothetical protein [Limibacillus sp. MBR-115]|jgi:hypothetical protein|uniref:hypothetical protein n=1 Tax=Limibacillus sp. MBR-115 TaxID=3156465 RepID=UPI003397E9B2
MRSLAVMTLLFCGLLSSGRGAAGESFRAAGFTFSDERGGFNLLSVSGSGHKLDPLVIVEEITDFGPVLLVIRADSDTLDLHRGKSGMTSTLNLSVIKVVINRTERAWSAFDMELREEENTPSPYGDGLSFGQMAGSERKLESDSFNIWHQLDEPLDRISFIDGGVDSGAAAQFTFQITDPTLQPVFFLLQEPRWLISGSPTRLAAGGPNPLSESLGQRP